MKLFFLWCFVVLVGFASATWHRDHIDGEAFGRWLPGNNVHCGDCKTTISQFTFLSEETTVLTGAWQSLEGYHYRFFFGTDEAKIVSLNVSTVILYHPFHLLLAEQPLQIHFVGTQNQNMYTMVVGDNNYNKNNKNNFTVQTAPFFNTPSPISVASKGGQLVITGTNIVGSFDVRLDSWTGPSLVCVPNSGTNLVCDTGVQLAADYYFRDIYISSPYPTSRIFTAVVEYTAPTLPLVYQSISLAGLTVTIVGSKLGSTITNIAATVDGVSQTCTMTVATTTLVCPFGSRTTGTNQLPWQITVLNYKGYAYPFTASVQWLVPVINSCSPNSISWNGGGVVSVLGSNFGAPPNYCLDLQDFLVEADVEPPTVTVLSCNNNTVVVRFGTPTTVLQQPPYHWSGPSKIWIKFGPPPPGRLFFQSASAILQILRPQIHFVNPDNISRFGGSVTITGVNLGFAEEYTSVTLGNGMMSGVVTTMSQNTAVLTFSATSTWSNWLMYEDLTLDSTTGFYFKFSCVHINWN